ncbi:MAG: hypothetical protein HC884_08860 [Chloroflexaceae bacterium]|nr:hypothetical protein [Chloroflexaceae bacterium]
MILPCNHHRHIVDQVQPTIDLLTHMDTWHPEILIQHAIQPQDYQEGLVFRSAIESIRGRFIASSTSRREGLVRAVLEKALQRSHILDYRQSGSSSRHDFTVKMDQKPDYFVALEVKGGEGNSINISERPLWAKEFGVWCHLDGAIVNQPTHGAHSIMNRLINELVKRRKVVDVVFFKDMLCGTRTRPCPKYPDRGGMSGENTAPDIFLLPQRVPSPDDPEPPVHSLESLKLPGLILHLFDVPPDERSRHIWEVRVTCMVLPDGRFRSVTEVWNQGYVVDRSTSRPWSLENLA